MECPGEHIFPPLPPMAAPFLRCRDPFFSFKRETCNRGGSMEMGSNVLIDVWLILEEEKPQ